jgi:hypothetical protein
MGQGKNFRNFLSSDINYINYYCNGKIKGEKLSKTKQFFITILCFHLHYEPKIKVHNWFLYVPLTPCTLLSYSHSYIMYIMYILLVSAYFNNEQLDVIITSVGDGSIWLK